MSRRDFDLYRAERATTRRVERVVTVVVVLAVAGCRAAILGAGWVADHTPRRRAR